MKKYLWPFLILCLFMTGCGVSTIPESDVIDGINFKTSYENENNKYFHLEIDKNNPFKYLTSSNISTVFAGTNIVFIGYPKSNVSRNVVNFILSNSKNFDIGTIYYFDLEANRVVYDINNDELLTLRDGTDLYSEMILMLDEYLNNIVVIDGNAYTVSDKYMTAPAFVFIKNGEIIAYYDDFRISDGEDFFGFDQSEVSKITTDLYYLIEKYED